MKPNAFSPEIPDNEVGAQPLVGSQRHAGSHAVRQVLNSGVLFAGGSEVMINHGSETYHLRLTRQNKLILTK